MKKYIFCFLLFASFFSIYAQKGDVRRGNKLYSSLSYALAIPHYEKALEKDSLYPEALHKIAESYRLSGNSAKALFYYAKVMNLADVTPMEKYRYGELLMKNGEYERAKPWLVEYKNEDKSDARPDNQLYAIEHLQELLKDTTRFQVSLFAPVNTSHSDFGPAFFGEQFLYSSNHYNLNAFDNNHGWTNNDYYALYVYGVDKQGKGSSIRQFSSIETKYNNGPVYFDESHQQLYVTRNQTIKKKVVKATDEQIKLHIISYLWDSKNQKWINEAAFQYNNHDYNVGHPALSQDGNTLIFTSDMPGGYGGMDLYICQRDSSGWSVPQNLGSMVNTKGNEVFPFIWQNNVLLFTSDGLHGLGGFDIFLSKLKNNVGQKPVHLTYPLNTQWDDFSLILNNEGKVGYFCSNRMGGKGDDDIYKVNVLKPLLPKYYLRGTVTDKYTGKILPNSQVNIVDTLNNSVLSVLSDSLGRYACEVDEDMNYKLHGSLATYEDGVNRASTYGLVDTYEVVSDLVLTPNLAIALHGLVTDKKTGDIIADAKISIVDYTNKAVVIDTLTNITGEVYRDLPKAKIHDKLNYSIKVEKRGYLTKTLFFNKVIEKPGVIHLQTELDFTLEKIEVGLDLAKILKINPIYFDLSKWNIRPDAAVELDKIVKVMKENPTMVIELGSHTDCRATAKFNLDLSDKRAKSSAAYIVSKGIEKSRIYGKGYGESKLVNDCGCEGPIKSTCSEEEHQRNRRTEFIIVKM